MKRITLAIDAGNTRIKWGLHDGNCWLAQGTVLHHEINALPAAWRAVSPHIDDAIVCSVAGNTVKQALQCSLDKISTTWLTACAEACGVTNGYDTPAQLGADRWAALIAAWHRHHQACVVVSAGTALTVDALSSNGEFVGGLIVPGLNAMQSALVSNTAGLTVASGQLCDFPANTADAMHSGALQAMAGAVITMQTQLQQREKVAPKLILSGGDAWLLQSALSGQGEIVDNLVLDGLVLLNMEKSA